MTRWPCLMLTSGIPKTFSTWTFLMLSMLFWSDSAPVPADACRYVCNAVLPDDSLCNCEFDTNMALLAHLRIATSNGLHGFRQLSTLITTANQSPWRLSSFAEQRPEREAKKHEAEQGESKSSSKSNVSDQDEELLRLVAKLSPNAAQRGRELEAASFRTLKLPREHSVITATGKGYSAAVQGRGVDQLGPPHKSVAELRTLADLAWPQGNSAAEKRSIPLQVWRAWHGRPKMRLTRGTSPRQPR